MSNSLAIAAVTATLRNLLNDTQKGLPAELADAAVTTKPLDKAGNGNGSNEGSSNLVNLFLYQTEPNAAWRNMEMPIQVKPGETGQPPLALNLYYLITAYGKGDEDILAHRLLGKAMSIFHDRPVLGRAEIEAALPGNNLYQQVERVRITPQPMSSEEMSKLWATFQTQYRISAAYQVAVVLIDSTRPGKAALPILSRGSDDRGVNTVASSSPFLREVHLPNRKPSAELGDILKIRGEGLDSDNLMVRFRYQRSNFAEPSDLPILLPVEISPLPERAATEMQVQLPTADTPGVPAQWPAGFYTLSLVIQRPNLPNWTTNELPFCLAPQLVITQPTPPPGATIAEAPTGDVNLRLTCTPPVLLKISPGEPVKLLQRVILLFGDREISVQSASTIADSSTELNFLVRDAEPETYILRLRVDGVDSIPIDFTNIPPQFADDQKVKINPLP
ncbi:MAG: DUF4255 domain-containing protein [Synechococcus sp.]